MKFFKTHLSLILPLLFMMFAFEFILLTNATLRHYEELVNKDYNIIVASSAELDKNVIKTKLSSFSSLEPLDPKDLIDRLKNDISDKKFKKFYEILYLNFIASSLIICLHKMSLIPLKTSF